MNEQNARELPAIEAAYRINGSQVPREAFYALACNPARSVAVEACAGAGKTWMLVSRILRALLDGCAPQDILAITFTRKAAGEMRDRLNAELRRCAAASDEELAETLRMRGLGDAQARDRVNELRSLYHHVTALGRPVQIRTFHSWFAALLRAAPLSVLQDLRLPAQYELLEDDAQAVAQVWPRFYAALSKSESDRQDFLASVAEHGRHQTLRALNNALQKRVEFSLADAAGVVESSVQPFAALYPRWSGLSEPELALMQPGARQRWLARAGSLGREANKTPRAAASAVIDAFALADESALMSRRMAMLRKGFFVASEDRLSNHLGKFEAAREAEPELQDLCNARRQHQAWQHHQRMARLTRVLLAAYAELKRERGWVDMNDVEGAALRLLGDAELSGWMQQRLDARVRHVLIDEFQDTNPLQWQALYGWLSAYAGAGPGEAPSVFLVGDPKQSIYRFRRAEPQVFKAAQAFVQEGLSGALLSCDHTRRCARGVVRVINSTMQAAVDAGEYGSDYRLHTTESVQAGAVLALPQVARGERAAGATGEASPWRDSLSVPRVLPEETLSAQEARQAADWVAAEIAAQRVRAEDIMVLSRRRERLAWMHDALLERGIASEQPEKLDLCEAPAVQDVVALLDVLVSPRHDLSLARALRSPLFGWTDDALAQVARLRQRWSARRDAAADGEGIEQPVVKPSWWDVLQRFALLASEEQVDLLRGPWTSAESAQMQAGEFSAAAQRLALYRGWLLGLPPHDALSALYEHGDVLAQFARAVPASQRAAVLAQLRDLLTQSLAQEGGRFLSAYRLVRALKAGGIQATPGQTHGAVRLLTIHGAKGLEAHTVLMLDTETGASRPENMGVLVDWPGEAAAPRRFIFLASEKSPPACATEALQIEQQARALEELNALYVALTRAEQRLVISSFEPHQRGNSSSWYQRLQGLAEPVEVPGSADSKLHPAPVPDFELPCLPACTLAPRDSQAIASAPPADDQDTRMGLALHRLLQWHPTPSRSFDWTAAHVQAAASEFGLTQGQVREVLAMARRMAGGEAAWAWDADQLVQWGNEVDVLHQGALLRLDRLVRRRATGAEPATWWVLDFKSAERPERQPELIAQMRRYREAMILARPGEAVRLAFISSLGQLVELTPDLLTP